MGLLQDKKSLGPARGPEQLLPQATPTRPATGLLGDSWLTAPSPVKQGWSNTVRDLVA